MSNNTTPTQEPENRNSQTGVITITCGANTYPFGDLSGRSVGQVLDDLKDILNAEPGSKVIVSGEEVNRDYILQPGDRVEVVKESGDNG